MAAADFIAIDVGNTHMTIGLMAGREVLSTLKVSSKAADREDRAARAGAYFALSNVAAKTSAAIASVNPAGTDIAKRIVQENTGGAVIELGVEKLIPIENRTLKPEQVGKDRLVNALAAWHLVRGPAIVVDFGTAVTFDVVSADGAYLGGVIAPGIGLAMRALSENTALLPLVKPEGRPPVLGRDTVSAINAGVYYGFTGMTARILEELFTLFDARPRVLATGGDGAYLAHEIPLIDEVAPNLTLLGIRLAWEG